MARAYVVEKKYILMDIGRWS